MSFDNSEFLHDALNKIAIKCLESYKEDVDYLNTELYPLIEAFFKSSSAGNNPAKPLNFKFIIKLIDLINKHDLVLRYTPVHDYYLTIKRTCEEFLLK